MNKEEYEAIKVKLAELEAKLSDINARIAAAKGKDFKLYSNLSKEAAWQIRAPMVQLMGQINTYEKEHPGE